MISNESFSSCHPVVNFTYFTLVILFSMFFTHPACLMISLCGALSYSIYLNGSKAIKFNLKYMLPMFVITSVLNPVFIHEGATILAHMDNGNPITLESIMYGIASAVILVTVICWFSCYHLVMTSDKFVYLFGKIIPSISLIFSMALRFIPRFKARLKTVSGAQKGICGDASGGSIFNRIKHGIKILSIMVTWMLENSIETADSMKSRGYGLKGRSSFSIYSFDYRDKTAFSFIVILGCYILIGTKFNGLYYRYYPTIKGAELSGFTVSQLAAYAALCFMPLAINVWEDRKWKLLQSKT